MGDKLYRGGSRLTVGLISLAILVMPLPGRAQTQTPAPTKITYHSNKYKPSDDVRLGRQAAQEAERQMPILHDPEATAYLERVGQRLVAAIPEEFQHPEFHYYFKIVNASDINAFALPGGPMYVNRGMIEAAKTEGEMAGVMAHELSHVALRHGTAQATKAQKYAIPAGVLGVLGTMVAGPAGGQLAQAPVGMYFLHFSREYETEADLLGARIMSRAGYDPHDLANMFKTIERTTGSKGGGFLSDHPNSEDRYAKITQEARALPIANPPMTDNRDFLAVQASLRGLPRAQTTAEIARNGQRYPAGGSGRYPGSGGGRYPDDDDDNYPANNGRYPSSSGRRNPNDNGSSYPDNNGRNPNGSSRRGSDDNSSDPGDNGSDPSTAGTANRRNRNSNGGVSDRGSSSDNARLGRVPAPSLRYVNYSELGIMRVNIPDNWKELPDQGSVWFAPQGGYGSANGKTVYTHAVAFGTAQPRSRNLQQATDEFITNMEQASNDLRATGGYQKATLGGRDALTISLRNTNETTGQPEIVTVTTALTASGDLLYMASVRPETDAGDYQTAFGRVLRSVQLSN